MDIADKTFNFSFYQRIIDKFLESKNSGTYFDSVNLDPMPGRINRHAL